MGNERELPTLSEGLAISGMQPGELGAFVHAGRISLWGAAFRLVEESASGLTSYDDGCELLSAASLLLELDGFFLTPRRGAYLLKDALFAFDTAWAERRIPRYESLPPVGVPQGQYFSPAEAMELLASTVRMRPEITSADIARVGLVRGTQQPYPGQWMLILIWDHRGQAVFFDRKDFESLIVVDEPISSRSPDSR